jgi:hypothetical protein
MAGADGVGECGLASGGCGGGEAARVMGRFIQLFNYSVVFFRITKKKP